MDLNLVSGNVVHCQLKQKAVAQYFIERQLFVLFIFMRVRLLKKTYAVIVYIGILLHIAE